MFTRNFKPSRIGLGGVASLITLSLLLLVATGCPTETGSPTGGGSAYQVVYEGNGATGGSPPVDDALYETGTEVTVLDNTGELARFGYGFTGWNSSADGAGDAFTAGETITMGDADITLYAAWEQLFLPTDGTVASYQKISDTEGGFTGTLADGDLFGRSVTSLGDLDGDGVVDIAVGVMYDDDGGSDRGAVWILFLNSDGTVKSGQKISDTEGGFTGQLYDADYFGYSVASPGDLDRDGTRDLIVGAAGDNDGGTDSGALWVLFLEDDGTVESHQKISGTEGGISEPPGVQDVFGASVASIGDLNGDGVSDLAVGATSYGDDDGAAVWILFMNTDGTVAAHEKTTAADLGFTGAVGFGTSVAPIGDLDGDGVTDLGVGALSSDGDDMFRGAVWVLFMKSDGTVKSSQRISDTGGAFTGTLVDFDGFGYSLAGPGDIDHDGTEDLIVGALGDGDGGSGRGAVWVLLLNSDGTVKSHRKISDTEGGFGGILDDSDSFGTGVTSLEDLNGDGVIDLAVTAGGDDDGGTDRGAVWVLFLDEAE
jgi:uncharacterized repeat protein (TIGR02543 family)